MCDFDVELLLYHAMTRGIALHVDIKKPALYQGRLFYVIE